MIPDAVKIKFNEGLRKGAPDECWPFEGGSYNKPGWHRLISHRDARGKRNYPAHRVAYTLLVGPIPAGMSVLHRCDNPPCCNPQHLFLGTQADNARDMWNKGRGRPGSIRGRKLGPSPHRRLDRESVKWAVRKYLAGRSQKDIAAQLGVTDVALGHCFRGHTYKEFADVVAPVADLLGRGAPQRRKSCTS